jgi:hypothetical protein
MLFTHPYVGDAFMRHDDLSFRILLFEFNCDTFMRSGIVFHAPSVHKFARDFDMLIVTVDPEIQTVAGTLDEK